jgi:hypothetical protein
LEKVEPNQPLEKVEPNQPLEKVEPNPLSKFNFLLNIKYQIQDNLIFDNVFLSGFGSTFSKG